MEDLFVTLNRMRSSGIKARYLADADWEIDPFSDFETKIDSTTESSILDDFEYERDFEEALPE